MAEVLATHPRTNIDLQWPHVNRQSSLEMTVYPLVRCRDEGGRTDHWRVVSDTRRSGFG